MLQGHADPIRVEIIGLGFRKSNDIQLAILKPLHGPMGSGSPIAVQEQGAT